MLHNLSVGELAERLRLRELSSVELTRHFLGRIERLNPALNALITLTADAALDAALAFMPVKAAADMIAGLADVSRKAVYARALERKKP